MKNWITISLILISLFSYGQNEGAKVTQSNDNIDYTNTKYLTLLFDSIQTDLSIDWKRFKQLEQLNIYNYSAEVPIKLSGLDKGKFKAISIANSDYRKFIELNELPKKIEKLLIWTNKDIKDTLTIPQEISRYKKIKYLSIGCCLPLNLVNHQLDKLKQLDTLILEAPLINSQQLKRLHHIKYLGLWFSTLNDSRVLIDSLLPNTKKEGWCFPPDQKIKVFNGQIKNIKELNIGDTLLGYDFTTKEITSTIITKITIHEKDIYPAITLGSNNLIASNEYIYVNDNIVTCTANHPIKTLNGSKRIDKLTPEDLVYHLYSDSVIEIKPVDKIESGFINNQVFDIESSTGNYFVNGILILNK